MGKVNSTDKDSKVESDDTLECSSDAFPLEAVKVLQSARFLHLGTSLHDEPHVSLMNYTFIARNDALPFEEDECIVVACRSTSKTFKNLQQNERVSCLVHDWTSHRNSVGHATTLQAFLREMNQMQMSSYTSATLAGTAQILSAGSEAEFLREKHSQSNQEESSTYTENKDTTIVKIKIKSARMTVGGVEGRRENWHSSSAE